MKNILLIACLFVGLNTVAQNRLEFNQIVSISGSFGSAGYSQLDTVPAGKAYKVTGFNQSGSSYSTFLTINGSELQPVSYKGGLVFPLWLKEGDILGVFRSTSSVRRYHISGIEFNIVQ
jgi:hypothetical protein